MRASTRSRASSSDNMPRSVRGGGRSSSSIIVTRDLRERKAIMETRSDAFVALPGGFGTLEEILEFLTLKQLATHAKPVVFLNARGFFNPLLALFEQLYREQFAKAQTRDHYHVAAAA